MERSYARLGIEDFGRHLLDSEDLDPVYTGLVGAGFPPDQLRRWLLAYWCLYHAGAASWISQHKAEDFWLELHKAALNARPAPTGERWPRGHERRHFRGKAAISAASQLQVRYEATGPEGFIDYVSWMDNAENPKEVTCQQVMKRVKEHHLFGSWIGFKVADMLERVMARRVNFDQASVFLFKDPEEAAIRLWRARYRQPEKAQPRDRRGAIEDGLSYLATTFQDKLAPPLRDRPVGLQELETILCKWKSHQNGHYPLLNDTVEIRQGLEQWAPHSKAAQKMLDAMPTVPS